MVVNNLQNKNHNQRNKKKKRIVFICSFGLMFILSSLLLHFFSWKKMGPLPWSVIGRYSWALVLCSLIFAFYVVIEIFDDIN